MLAGALMYAEDELLPISALQHLLFCERRCALVHVDNVWAENRYTAEGRVLHERAHEASSEWRDGVRIVRGLRLRSLRLGLIGIADVVEFRDGVPFPVEYKRGKPKTNACDEVQLCAQAMCLEEMLGCKIASGALFYGKTRRRKDVALDETLRALAEHSAKRLHGLVKAGRIPAAIYEPKCESCSLQDVCMPELQRSAVRYLEKEVEST
jgi:CRISPR-associated exonuclease Cas4